jgi:Tfp pilus assembly protein PilF
MIVALGQLKGLRVAGRASSFVFKGQTPDLAEIGAKLKVASVLTGSVRKVGSRIRISVELVNVADGFQLWSERYDRQTGDIFAIQDEIASSTAEKLRVSLAVGPAAPHVKRPTTNPEAYELYLKGRVLLNQRGKAVPEALEFFKGAVALDPDYALAHAGLADTYIVLAFYGAIPQWQAMPKAKDAARRAIALDPSLADPHAVMYYVHYCTEWDFAAAAREMDIALRLNPRLSTALNWYSFFLAAGEGRIDEASAIARRAAESDPLAAYPMVILGNSYWFARRLDEAEKAMRRATELEPLSWPAWRNLGIVQALCGNRDDGIATLERALTLSDRHVWVLVTLADALTLAGRRDEARSMHEEVVQRARTSYVQSIWLGYSYSVVGEMDAAFQAFDQAERNREALPLMNHLWYMARDARTDPRFAAMMRRTGVTPAPDLVG